MGRDAAPEVLAQFGEITDPEVRSYVNRVGSRLAAGSHRPDLEWHFAVLDSPTVNAMALPGGYIYLTREIMSYMNNEAEMAAILGHEIGHVTYRHSVSQLSKAQLAQVGLTVGSIFSPTFSQLAGLAGTGLQLLFLKNSREAERESDEVGIEYAAKAGYDPREVSDFFDVLQRLSDGREKAIPDWLSTHPNPGERVQTTRAIGARWVAQLPRQDFIVGREDHLRRIEGLIFGNNPREGFTKGSSFFHPELRFRIQFPSGWEVQNTKQAVLAVSSRGDAAIQLTVANTPAGTTPEAYAGGLSRQGLEPLSGRTVVVNNNPAFVGQYQFQNAEGVTLQALALFVSHRDRLYQIVGMTPARLSAYERLLTESLFSFDELTDRSALSVQPERIRIVRARAGETLASLIRRERVTTDPNQISLLNRMPLNQRLNGDTLVKLVSPPS
jgi:predicted Zn-dependent protease